MTESKNQENAGQGEKENQNYLPEIKTDFGGYLPGTRGPCKIGGESPGKIVGPVEVTLAKGYKPGEKGNPTIKEFGDALRRELSDFLEPNHPIIFRSHQKTVEDNGE